MPLPELVDDQLLDALQAELTGHLGYDNLLAIADERGAQDQQRAETTGPGSPARIVANIAIGNPYSGYPRQTVHAARNQT